jgi:DNA repair protein RecN (Recombination protein N)
MLQELTIRNFAIIDDLHVNFSEGLSILSGETGAGKSIILNAVNLLLGSRASAELVRTGSESAELEALFRIAPSSDVAKLMTAHEFNIEDGLIVRRIISRSDSNRVYINGRLATIQVLNSITENLASISGQHAHQGLLKEDQHLLILDQFGGLLSLRQKLNDGYHEILPMIDKLNTLMAIREQQAEHLELLEFQKKEITQTGIIPGEDRELEQEKMRLKNAATLYQSIFGKIDSQLSATAESLAESAYHIEDLVAGLRRYLNIIQLDDKRLEAVEERLDTLNKLKRKYGGSLEAVLKKLESIEQDLSGVENITEKISALEQRLSELHRRLADLSLQLSEKRKKTATSLAQKVIDELASLKMSPADFRALLQTVQADQKTNPHLVSETNVITEFGIDRAIPGSPGTQGHSGPERFSGNCRI